MESKGGAKPVTDFGEPGPEEISVEIYRGDSRNAHNDIHPSGEYFCENKKDPQKRVSHLRIKLKSIFWLCIANTINSCCNVIYAWLNITMYPWASSTIIITVIEIFF